MKNLIALLILLILFSCGSEPKPLTDLNEPVSKNMTVKHLAWLAGTWKSVQGEEMSYEIWSLKNDSLLIGNGYVIVKGDTVFSEKLEIQQKGEDVFYIATIANQNNGQPVPFRFMQFDKGEYNFVNKEHDFPQRIIYKNPQPDFLVVRIEGMVNGKERKEDFNFVKVK